MTPALLKNAFSKDSLFLGLKQFLQKIVIISLKKIN